MLIFLTWIQNAIVYQFQQYQDHGICQSRFKRMPDHY